MLSSETKLPSVLLRRNGKKCEELNNFIVSSYLPDCVSDGIKSLCEENKQSISSMYLMMPMFQNSTDYDAQIGITETKRYLPHKRSLELSLDTAKRGLFEETGLWCSSIDRVNDFQAFQVPARSCSLSDWKYRKGIDDRCKSKVAILVFGSLEDIKRCIDVAVVCDPNERILGFGAIRMDYLPQLMQTITAARKEWIKSHSSYSGMAPIPVTFGN